MLRGSSGSILAADPPREVARPVANPGIVEGRADRGSELGGPQILHRERLGAGARPVNRGAPEVLVALKGTHDGRSPGEKARVGQAKVGASSK